MESVNQDPREFGFVQNPYTFYDRARKHGPFVFWNDYNMACAVSHDAVSGVLKSRKMGREAPEESVGPRDKHLASFYQLEDHSLLELEPPRHTRIRALVLRAFTSRQVQGLAPAIETACLEQIEDFPSSPFDLIDTFAKWVPVKIICRLLGVPEQNAADLLTWSNSMVAMYQATRSREVEDLAAQASSDFTDYMRDCIAHKRRKPGDDLLTELIDAETNGQKLSEAELVSTCILLLNAGHEATVHTIGNGVSTLLQHDIKDVDDATVEEILRYDPPLHIFTRWVYDEVEFAGQRFKRGDKVACLLASANRDQSVFGRPDEFVPTRTDTRNVSFGAGIHFCVGAPLARLEILIALRTLLRECPSLHLVGHPKYADIYHFHGLEQLTVRL